MSAQRFLSLLLAVAAAAPALAAGGAELHVVAVLRKHASVRVIAQPGMVEVTRADIARGYVDVAAPLQLAVRSNVPEGVQLVFDRPGDVFGQARIRGLANEVQLGAAGGIVTQRVPSAAPHVLALAFRFELGRDAQEGTYPWPMQVSAAPL